ncbi:MAG: sigma-70 family RNA polymerase sigma factor [Saprospiraceae bacterium]|jgi:RNA polymerase sigma factor (sigma-70 family)|nr:sigma-70 family RNA polymerase sigma factor [Saprospiraceae bacterium]MBK7795858.1 sigma-70 family RNA polymerase sigma factor [Saprospiraceae bacterium]MBK9379344.1 sigma-70 family RNA polymerase sigma factor [Saprospiraceae bacterium]MBL0260969.1 sigma-70 family RNA polymerase sigma factor [Saprospiraceae bacterium]HMS28701.1 sigma-70 family RNA polymerase sigma factor [Saprospiraceae bacterium]
MQVAALSDQALIDLYLSGNEKAFQVLLERHQQKIYTSIYLFVKDRDLAEDLFQEVFIKIIDTLRKGTYSHEGKFSQWATRIAYNLCVDHFRRGRKRSKVNSTDEFDIFDVLELPDDNREDEMIMSETHGKIRQLVDMLPQEQREVVVLRHYADLSFKEIAQITRVSINTALGRMRYALINIRKLMEENAIVLQ